MAKVWFVRRRGTQWVAPGGAPAFEAPLSQILFPLDIGTHRRLDASESPRLAAELPVEPAEALHRVMVELDAGDVVGRDFSGYRPGLYDSALSPTAAAVRLRHLVRAEG